jgi:hypothetical protein
MKTIGHHTCSKKNGRKYVLKNAPFFSQHDKKKNALKFLGSGYYYWDDNIEMAHYWGKTYYHKKYFIVESNLNLPEGIFLDLVGNRRHLRYFRELISKFEAHEFGRPKWTMGVFIEFLKTKEKDVPGIFPFKAIRAVDIKVPRKNKSTIKFVDNKPNVTNLDPRLVICLTEKNSVILQSQEIVSG